LNFEAYERKKKRLNEIQSAMSGILSSFSLTHQVQSIEKDKHQMENEQFHLVVVGEFSRGKSTFVNAMLGRRMLPSSKEPTTAVISKIVYGEQPEYVLHYKSGGEQSISEETFSDIKAQSEEGVNIKDTGEKRERLADIEYVEIRYPLPFCKNHVEVVDTPGTNDLNAGRVEITHNYLRRADAAILVLWATQVLTQSELDFLRKQLLGNQIHDIFVVINGKDNCKDGDESRVVEYVLQHLSKEITQGLRVFPVSSKQALNWRRKEQGEKLPASALRWTPKSIEETGFPAFEEALTRFLDEEQGRVKLEKYVARMQQYFEAVETQIQSQYGAAAHSTDELRIQLRELRPKVRKAKADATQIMKTMEASLFAREPEIANEAQKTFQQMQQAALKAVDECALDASGGEVQHQVDVATTPIQEEFIEKCAQLQEMWTREAWNRALEALRRIWTDIELEHNENLPVTFRHDFSVQFENNVTQAQSDSKEAGVGDWIKLGVCTALGGVTFLACMAAVVGVCALGEFYGERKQREDEKKAIHKKYNEQYRPFIDNTKEQYRKTVSQICAQLSEEVEGRLDDMEQQLASVVQMKEASEADAEAVKAKLSERYDAVQRLKKELAEVTA